MSEWPTVMKKCSVCHQSWEKWKMNHSDVHHTHSSGRLGTLRMMWDKLHPSYTAVGLRTITPENSLAAPAEYTYALDPVIPLLDLHPQKDIHRDIHSSTVCSSPRPETSEMLTHVRRKKVNWDTVIPSDRLMEKGNNTEKLTHVGATWKNLRNGMSGKSRTH